MVELRRSEYLKLMLSKKNLSTFSAPIGIDLEPLKKKNPSKKAKHHKARLRTSAQQ